MPIFAGILVFVWVLFLLLLSVFESYFWYLIKIRACLSLSNNVVGTSCGKRVVSHFWYTPWNFSTFNLQKKWRCVSNESRRHPEPFGLLLRSFPVATTFLPRSYLVSSGLLSRTQNVLWTYLPACYRLTIGLLIPCLPLPSALLDAFFQFSS